MRVVNYIGQLGLRWKSGPPFPAVVAMCCRTRLGTSMAGSIGRADLRRAYGMLLTTVLGFWNARGGGDMACGIGWVDRRTAPGTFNLMARGRWNWWDGV